MDGTGKRKLKKADDSEEDSKEPGSKKIFTCSYKDCGKQFTELGNLKAHIRIHVTNFIIIDWRKTFQM